jgi:hypothetical protein
VQVSLGGVELRDFEKPDYISRGGQQMLAVREFPGGNVSVQDLGPKYRPISWSGMFIGSDAYDRMMKIGLMRTAGNVVELVTDKFTLPVMISEFLPDIKTLTRIPFSITLQIVMDEALKSSNTLVDSVDKAADQSGNDSSAKQVKTYVVKQGDTLWKIASTETTSKNPNDWEKIYQDNVSVLVNGPHLLTVGMELKISV